MKKLLTFFLLTFSLSSLAQDGHIADDVYIFYHGGPSNQYRITGRINSGSPVTILKTDPGTKYVQIRTESGRTGWVAPNNVARGPSIAARLPALEDTLKQGEQVISEQRATIERLQAELNSVQSERVTLSDEVNNLKTEIKTLSFQMESMDESNLMRWFTYGGMTALGGVILGLLMRSFSGRKKNTSSW